MNQSPPDADVRAAPLVNANALSLPLAQPPDSGQVSATPRRRRRRWLWTLLKAAISLALIAALLWRQDLHALALMLSQYDWLHAMSAVALFLLCCALSVARWRLFAVGFGFWHLLELSFIGQFYAVLLPGQLAGELVKAYRLAKGRADAEQLAASVAVDRIVGTIALLLVGSTGYLLSPHHLPSALGMGFAILTAALFAGLMFLRLPFTHQLAMKVISHFVHGRTEALASSLRRLVLAWHDFSNQLTRLVVALVLGIVFQLLMVAIYALLANNLGITLAATDWMWVATVASLAVLLPVSIGGIGLREGALVGCLAFLGVSSESALALSTGILILMLLGAAIGGIAEFVHTGSARNRA